MEQVSAVLLSGHGVAKVFANYHQGPVAKIFGHAEIISMPQLGRPGVLCSADATERIIRKHYGSQPLVIMGHSFGGLVAVELADRLGEQVRRVVAMSTPFHGTRAAFAARLPFMRWLIPSHVDMEPDSEYLKDLWANRLPGVMPRLATVAYFNDGLVNWQSTYVEGAECNYLVGDSNLHQRALARYQITPVEAAGPVIGGHLFGPLLLNGHVSSLLRNTWDMAQA